MSALAAAALLTLAASAATPDDYGYAWPIEVPRGAGAYAIELSPSIYARLTDRNLRDFEVFDANGAGVPVAAAHVLPRSAPPPASVALDERVALPWFALAGEPGATGDDVTLRVERDADGRLRAAATDIRHASSRGEVAAGAWVVDATALVTTDRVRPVIAFELGWDEPAASATQLPLRVSGSNDFERWQPLGQGTLVDLRRDGSERLVRRRIAFAAEARYRYFRFEPAGSRHSLPINAFEAVVSERTAAVPTRHEVALAAVEVVGDAAAMPGSSVHRYRLAGPIPLERLAIELPPGASVAQLAIKSRDAAEASWQLRAAFTAFRVEVDGVPVAQDPVDVTVTRDREWRVEASPPLAAAPKVVGYYRADRYVVIEQGGGPYTLAAGSGVARRVDYPLDAPIAALRARFGESWQPRAVAIGAERLSAGEGALARPVPRASRERWLLWGVLIGGAAVLVVIVLKLLAEPRRRDPP